jgi:hypothetical protein
MSMPVAHVPVGWVSALMPPISQRRCMDDGGGLEQVEHRARADFEHAGCHAAARDVDALISAAMKHRAETTTPGNR